MKISELVKQLEAIQKEHGDLPVRVQSLSHTWDPEPTIQRRGGKVVRVMLNP